MTQKEKENRIHSFALEFLERQQIVPNLYADQIIKGYKEGYLQAEQDLEMKEVDFDDFGFYWGEYVSNLGGDINNYEVAKYFYELGIKTQKEE